MTSKASLLDLLGVLAIASATGLATYLFGLMNTNLPPKSRERIRVVHHSVTPNEMREIIKKLYLGYSEEYFEAVKWVNCVDERGNLVGCSEDEDKELTEKVTKIVASVLIKRTGVSEEEADRRARNIVQPEKTRLRSRRVPVCG